MYIIALILLYLVPCYRAITSNSAAIDECHWSQWSECSVTCGEGQRIRQRKCVLSDTERVGVKTERKQCYLQFCPGYLSWPRIHFSGKLSTDPATINNFRCAYDNEKFSGFMQSKKYIRVEKKTTTHSVYETKLQNWNPDGTNQMYFVDTFVTSICISPNDCSLTDPIVGSSVSELSRGVIAVIGPDWQVDEIWSLPVQISGVMTGKFLPSTRQATGNRFDKITVDAGYAYGTMSRFKSKLVNITWYDNYYRNLFSDARELSITFAYDLYNMNTVTGRVSGTFGLTASDDARQSYTTRVLQSVGIQYHEKLHSAPFFIHYDVKTLTLDLAYSVKGKQDGTIPDSDLGGLDLALLLSKKKCLRYFGSDCPGERNRNPFLWKRITHGEKISRKIGDDNNWYTKYGGVIDVDISHLDEKTLELTKNARIALIDRNDSVYMEEFPHGVNIGLMGFSSLRLDPGESGTFYGFVSSFGRPAKHAQVNLNIVKHEISNGQCDYRGCNGSIGIPREAIYIPANKYPLLTNSSGLGRLDVKAALDPGNPRGCGLDGQIYPLQLVVRYSRRGESFTYSNYDVTVNNTVQPTDFIAHDQPMVVKLYSGVPEKACPTWNDVKGIFIQYYNLYPVMWKTGIIDLHSYDNILEKAKVMKAAMIDFDIHDARYMPISRDLSKGKRKLIYNWMKCRMKRNEPFSKSQNNIRCPNQEVDTDIKELRLLFHKALMLELSTIPPYFTAWLSLKTEFGRNKEIAEILKSTINEEMLHMTLNGNILNALGGVVNMTDETTLPVYPTILGSGMGYQIEPDMEVALAPFSTGLVKDVFSTIEEPSRKGAREILYALAKIWKVLPSKDSDDVTSPNMRSLLRLYRIRNETESHPLSKICKSNSNEGRSAGAGIYKRNLEGWRKLAIFANENLNALSSYTAETVGELYLLLALKLTYLESCLQIRTLEYIMNPKETPRPKQETIFTGEIKYQLNISHWYQKSKNGILSVVESMGGDVTNSDAHHVDNTKQTLLTRPPLFAVTDLKTALEAIVEITYQGEGGSECSPFIPEADVYASEKGRDDGGELSHYYRFQEIANGRRLIKVSRPSECIRCLNISQPELCPSLAKFGEQYCYAGDPITFYEDGVWPILFNPQDKDYETGTKAHMLHKQFNVLYTRLLYCLEKTFGGDPPHIKRCMAIMYDLTIAGKKLVQTPLHVLSNTSETHFGKTRRNGAPTWLFVRDISYRAGLPLYLTRLHVGPPPTN